MNTDWLETYFEVVSAIALERAKDFPAPLIQEINDTQGTGGFYELAQELTDKFELENAEREWDGDFFDAIDRFMSDALNKHTVG